MRKVTVDCELCAKRMAIERGKEVLFETAPNNYHLVDVCSECLDGILQRAESINDTGGYRQRAAVLVKLPANEVPVVTAATRSA